jgi:para-aminobenzoate synthetase/4-amino-4-deoxychorismate lyase
MPAAIYGPPNPPARGWSFLLQSPLHTYSTTNCAEIIPLLNCLEAHAQAGAWVALMMTYEAAPAFDEALRTHEPATLPLLWAAVFDNAETVSTEERTGSYQLSGWSPEVSRANYEAGVTSIRELIARGDTYQVNYTFPLTALFSGDALALYRDLCEAQGADYCAYVDLGRYKVLSLSPELFFERTGDCVRTRPMKGTVRRGRASAEDRAMAQSLEESAKDRAENVMIVDLLRNDLGKVSVNGTVAVTKLFELERYPTLWQMTSTIEATQKPNTSLVDLLSALFPCGSITGAPKIRTTEIIRDLEPRPRNIYTGTIGLLKPGGDCVFNVAIRTLLLDSETGQGTFGVGSGITYDSTATKEYEECLLKSSFLQTARKEFQLLESLLLAGGEYFLLSRHVERLRLSAEYFGFQLIAEEVARELECVRSSNLLGDFKVRLLLNRDGQIESEVLKLEPRTLPLRVALAQKPVNSADAFLFHKTTNREIYDGELRARSDCADIIFWNENGEVTESTIANIVVSMDRSLVTPPEACGLLSGTFRNELLERGEINARVISLSDLRAAKEFYLINSVSRWMPAVLVE